jgi:DNA-binding MarR family transcriptional regulator
MSKLADEIRMTKPFSLPEEEATLNLMRTSELVQQQALAVLKPFDLSTSQYNVLRILRGAGSDGITCSQIGDRMISRDPDITRLLDRLETRGLLRRERSARDRRVVNAHIAPDGLYLLEEIDPLMAAQHRSQYAHFEPCKLRQLIELLELVRNTPTKAEGQL